MPKGIKGFQKGKDNPMFGKEPWHKGTKGIMKPNSGSFKKGQTSYNKGKKLEYMRGEKNCNWKGGKIKHTEGYICILKPNHPFCHKDGYVMEHRLVMEKHLGRYLTSKERVHHINGKRDDNRIQNLIYFPTDPEHLKYHRKKKHKTT